MIVYSAQQAIRKHWRPENRTSAGLRTCLGGPGSLGGAFDRERWQPGSLNGLYRDNRGI